MTVYRCTFDRVGRNHNIAPQTFTVPTDSPPDRLAGEVHRFVRDKVKSHEMEVVVDLDEMKGMIIVGGFRPAGDFTIEVLEPVNA